MSSRVVSVGVLLAVVAIGWAQEKPQFVCVARDGVSLITILAEAFAKDDPAGTIQIEREVHETVLTAVNSGRANLIVLGWGFSDQEKQKHGKVIVENMETRVVAFDPAAVLVNASGPTKRLSVDQLRILYSGKTGVGIEERSPGDRVDLNGQQIRVLALNKSHPSLRIIRGLLANGDDVGKHVENVAESGVLFRRLLDDLNTIAVARWSKAIPPGLAYVGIGDIEKPDIMPDEESVRSGQYPLSMPIVLAWKNGSPPAVKRFIDFALGWQGQNVVRKAGYVTIAGDDKNE